MMERSGSVPVTKGSGFERPKNGSYRYRTLDKRLRNLFINPFLGVCEVQERNIIQEVVEAL
jgi:hypothetical protein